MAANTTVINIQDDDQFASCADGQETHICYNGGECVPVQDQYVCDCTKSDFVGKWCHLPPETYCEPDLFCVNGGSCSDDNSCDCPDDYVGKHCEYRPGDVIFENEEAKDDNNEVPTTGGGNANSGNSENSGSSPPKESDSEQTPCGPNGDVCHHGSTCIRTIDGAYACDCSTVDAKHVAGRWCEYEATSYCDNDNNFFCVNDGTCSREVDDASGEQNFTCVCDESQWTGRQCEISVVTTDNNDQDDLTFANCTLTCKNGGECRKGAKTIAGGDDSVHSQDWEYCVCPKGYTGRVCQHEYQECGQEEHYCLHGTTCAMSDEAENGWTCDCPASSSSSCQRHSTTVCTDERAMNSPYDPTRVAYCVNDGVCTTVIENGESRAACQCPPGYTGVHCELYASVHDSNTSSKGQESAAIIFVGFILAVLLILLILVAVLRWRGKKRQQQKHITEAIAHAHMQERNSARQSAVMEEMDLDPDFDENDLEEVELL